MIWALEIIFFKDIYENIKINEIKDVGSQVVENYDVDNLDALLQISFEKECNIIVFNVSGDVANILFSSSRISDIGALSLSISNMLTELGTKTQTTYIQDDRASYTTVTFAQVATVNEETIYFYVNAAITPVTSTVEVLTLLLIIATSIGFLITLIMSIIFSKKISQPIMQIASSAKQLSGGNLEVNFNNKEYDEVAELSNTLNYAIAEIKKSEDLQKDVIANVSHELRTPLTMIKSYAELIDDFSGDDKEKRTEHIKIILEETDRLEYLVNDILDLSKLQAGTMVYTKEDFNLSETLTKFEKYYTKKYRPQGYQFIFKYPKTVTINADKKRIEQVIINLINNAINYSGDNKSIEITLVKVKNKNLYHLQIKDHGIGISKENQKQIFDRHFRSTNASRVIAGSGIGLSIVKQILNYHNFEFGVNSELNVGSTFFIDFPVS